jgi:hypothetical protein
MKASGDPPLLRWSAILPSLHSCPRAGSISCAPLRFEGKSMLPLLRPGDRIVTETPRAPLELGDVILFAAAHGLVLHRVISLDLDHERLTTRGDAMISPDVPISIRSVLGRFEGLYDSKNGCRTALPLRRKAWDKLMRALVRAERGPFRPVLVLNVLATCWRKLR